MNPGFIFAIPFLTVGVWCFVTLKRIEEKLDMVLEALVLLEDQHVAIFDNLPPTQGKDPQS